MKKRAIQTQQAPSAIGTYSQAIKVANTVYISGQIPLVPETMVLVEGDFHAEVRQVIQNLQAVCEAAKASLENIVKLTVYLTDLNNFSAVNEVMADYFMEPYPARAAIEVSALPKGATVEMDAILVCDP